MAAAASKALPPCSRIFIPTAEAIQWVHVATPKVPVISGRVVKVMEETGLSMSEFQMVARVERVAQPVAQKVEAQHHQEDRGAGLERHPGRLFEEVLGGVQHRAPGRRRRLLAQAEEGQATPRR